MSTASEHYQLRADIELLYATYNQTLDAGQIGHWPGFFVNQCVYKITTRENIEQHMSLCFVLCDGQAMLRDRAAALQRTVIYRRRYQRRLMSGIQLKTTSLTDTHEIETLASFAIFESVVNAPSQVLVCGYSSDVIVREADTLKFKQKICVIDSQVIPDSLVFPI